MTFYNSSRPKTLMELLLAKKIEAASAEGGSSRRIFRTDSMDSMSSVGSCTSSMLGEDVCRCDDCLLGIVDLYIIQPHERSSSKKKVTGLLFPELVLRKLHCKRNHFFLFLKFVLIIWIFGFSEIHLSPPIEFFTFQFTFQSETSSHNTHTRGNLHFYC